jgi:hypothetical protein
MTQRRSFDRGYLKQEFDKLDAIAKESMTLYLIGGGAMAFYGLKTATKDLDIILCTEEELLNLKNALSAIGYKDPNPYTITRPYNEMQTSIMLENIDGFRWDVFLTKVCGKLTLSKEMKNRATILYQAKKLNVLTASKEDLFLFKGITTRDADLEDTSILAGSGLDWATIAQECKEQSKTSGLCWEDALCQTLEELKTKYSIQSPIERALRKTADQKVTTRTLLEQIAKGNNNVQSIAKAINEPESFVRIQLDRLVKKGTIKADKSKKPYEFKIE